MKHKYISLLLIAVLVLSLQGCATCKGIWNGAKEGAKKDWQDVPKYDNWIKEHLW